MIHVQAGTVQFPYFRAYRNPHGHPMLDVRLDDATWLRIQALVEALGLPPISTSVTTDYSDAVGRIVAQALSDYLAENKPTPPQVDDGLAKYEAATKKANAK